MRNAILGLFLALICTLDGEIIRAETPRQQPARLDAQARLTLDYLLYLPADYEKNESWPLLVFLHGAGERGDDLELVKRHGPPKLIEQGKSFPFIVVSPQCPKDRWWSWQQLELTALVDEIVAKYKVDQDRIYLTGISMGGFGTWWLAAYTPERFAAMIPICGGGEVILTRQLTNLPIWVFHGAKDQIVPLKRSEELVDALKKVNPRVKFTIYPEADHDAWTATYDNPEIYTWLLEQKRKPASKNEPKSR